MRGARPTLRIVDDKTSSGTSSGSEVAPSAPEELGGNLIEPPSVLPPDIAAEWHRVAADLRERRLWKDAMAGMVTSYCLAQATLLRLEIAIAAEGDWVLGAGGARKPHPSTGLLRSSRETVARLGGELGLSPTARSRKALRPDPSQSDLFKDEWDL